MNEPVIYKIKIPLNQNGASIDFEIKKELSLNTINFLHGQERNLKVKAFPLNFFIGFLKYLFY
jgi:hypothetical protein